jgi:hypothetical protein
LFSAARSRQNPDTNEDDYAHGNPGWRNVHQIRGDRESNDKYNESNEISAERRHVFFCPVWVAAQSRNRWASAGSR